jgi:hypothetical protein
MDVNTSMVRTTSHGGAVSKWQEEICQPKRSQAVVVTAREQAKQLRARFVAARVEAFVPASAEKEEK